MYSGDSWLNVKMCMCYFRDIQKLSTNANSRIISGKKSVNNCVSCCVAVCNADRFLIQAVIHVTRYKSRLMRTDTRLALARLTFI